MARNSPPIFGLLICLVLFAPTSVEAGPPFLTDDPEPTDTGHWEIYGPLVEGDVRGDDYAGSVGAEVNYGAAPNVQVTVGLPLAFGHDRTGTRWGAGDISVAVKYRFSYNEDASLSIAVFPGMTLPTASNGTGSGKVTALLPVWVQKDFGGWSIFGGGGYAINPGDGNRDYWTGGIAMSRQVTDSLLLGIEADRQGADMASGAGSTSFGIGAILRLKAPFRLLASGGPIIYDDGAGSGIHAFLALGLDF